MASSILPLLIEKTGCIAFCCIMRVSTVVKRSIVSINDLNVMLVFGTITFAAVTVGVQGTSVKYSPQRVGVGHQMQHDDVIQIVKK